MFAPPSHPRSINFSQEMRFFRRIMHDPHRGDPSIRNHRYHHPVRKPHPLPPPHPTPSPGCHRYQKHMRSDCLTGCIMRHVCEKMTLCGLPAILLLQALVLCERAPQCIDVHGRRGRGQAVQAIPQRRNRVFEDPVVCRSLVSTRWPHVADDVSTTTTTHRTGVTGNSRRRRCQRWRQR